MRCQAMSGLMFRYRLECLLWPIRDLSVAVPLVSTNARSRLNLALAVSVLGLKLFDCWRRGQDSNLQALAGGGFQDRCITNYATPPHFVDRHNIT